MVILTENLFGDILSDEASVITGAIDYYHHH
jgi:isocitrate/isopropylmalate dehydrogenase